MATIITTNAHEAAAWVQEKHRSQIPFATALALTSVAFQGQRRAKLELATAMQLRNRFSASGIQVNPAEKGPLATMQAEVGIEQRRSYLIDHVTGGKREGGRNGRAILEEETLRGGNGRIARAKRPGALIAAAKRAKAKARARGAGQAKPLPFLLFSSRWGNEVLAQREGKGRYPLRILYAFRQGVTIRREFHMDIAVQQAVGASYYQAFEKAMRRAIATGKTKAERSASTSRGARIDSGR